MAAKKTRRSSRASDSTDAAPCPSGTTSPDHLQASHNLVSAELQRLPASQQLEHLAAEKLALGVSLRRRAQWEQGPARVQTLRKVIEAFEAALCIYCNILAQPTDIQPQESTDASTKEDEGTAGGDPIEQLLEAASGPFLGDVYELEEIVECLWERCSIELRSRDVAAWAVSMINLGGALTLLGKCLGETGRLQDAVNTFAVVLNEPRLSEAARERAIAYTNMADAMCAMGEMEVGAEQVACFEGAVSSLTNGLRVVAPAGLRCLVEDELAGLA
jgi:hypothetical protein